MLQVAMMLLTIVIVFIICHSIRSIVNVYECIQVRGGRDITLVFDTTEPEFYTRLQKRALGLLGGC